MFVKPTQKHPAKGMDTAISKKQKAFSKSEKDLLLLFFFLLRLRLHAPKYNIHQNNNPDYHSNGYPKADIQAKPFTVSEKRYPDFFPIHHFLHLL